MIAGMFRGTRAPTIIRRRVFGYWRFRDARNTACVGIRMKGVVAWDRQPILIGSVRACDPFSTVAPRYSGPARFSRHRWPANGWRADAVHRRLHFHRYRQRFNVELLSPENPATPKPRILNCCVGVIAGTADDDHSRWAIPISSKSAPALEKASNNARGPIMLRSGEPCQIEFMSVLSHELRYPADHRDWLRRAFSTSLKSPLSPKLSPSQADLPKNTIHHWRAQAERYGQRVQVCGATTC